MSLSGRSGAAAALLRIAVLLVPDPGVPRLRSLKTAWRGWLTILTVISLSLQTALVVGVPATAFADPESPITVTNVDSPDPVASGAELTYTITIVNTGGAKVDSLVLTDQVNGVGGIGTPPQLVLTSSQGSCSQSNLKVTCLGGSLNGRQSWTVTIRGIVTAANGTTINNTASVTGTKSAQNFTTAGTTTTLVANGGGGAPKPDLMISKAGPSSVVTSSNYSYTLTVNNSGTANATNVRVVDTLPAGVDLVSAQTTSLFVCTPAGPAPSPVAVTCTGGAVNQGSNATITLNVTAPPAAGTIANTAVVDPNDTIDETNELNNTSATVSTTVTSGPAPQGLTVKKTDTPDPVNPGGMLTYTVVVTNVATTRADDVVMVDGTQGLEAASITASQVISNGAVGNNGGCTVSAPQVRCSIRSLDPGGTQTVTIKGQVTGSAGSTLFNTATATANIRNQGVSATDSALTTIKPAADLTLTVADAPEPVCARSWPTTTTPAAQHLTSPPDGLAPASGDVPPLLAAPVCLGGLTYTIVVGNSGTSPATGVVVRDPLPDGTIFDSYSTDGGFSCAVDASNVVTCSGGTVPAESTKQIKLLLVAPPTTGPVTNTVTVDPNNAIFEADETNNTATQPTQVSTGVDLVVWKSDSNPANPPGDGAPTLTPGTATDGFDPIATRGTQTYTIYVDNVGTQDTTNIRVRDTLPADTIFLSAVADPSHGFTCAHNGAATGGVVECNGGKLLGTESEFYARPGTPPPAPLGDDFATIKIRLFARHDVGTMHNEVRVDPDNTIAEFNEQNNIATDETTVTNGDGTIGAFNELTITKTADKPTVSTSSTVVYTIVVGNSGTNPAVNVKLEDTLPAGFTYVEAKDSAAPNDPLAFQCSFSSGNVVTCSGATINAGASRTITITALSSAVPGTYVNQALVDPGNAIAEGNETNNAAQATTTVNVGEGNVDLQVEKSDSPDPVTPLGTLTYTITAKNVGSSPAFNVKVRDDLPASATFVSAVDTAGGAGAFACNYAGSGVGGTVTCTGGTLDGTPGDPIPGVPTSRTITIVVKAPNQHNATLTNQAIVDPDGTIAESNETNNQVSITTSVQSAINLTLTKDGPTTASQGQTADYKLTVKNEGTAPAFGVKVHDPLPTGLIPLTSVVAGGNFTCTVSENPVNVVNCTGDLAAGEQIDITIPVFITAESGTLDNEACVDPDNQIAESNEDDNCKTKRTAVVKFSPNLLLNKAADKAAVTQGETLTYTITVSNAGDADAASPVTIKDTLPTSVTLVGQPTATNGFTCSATTPITCTDGGSGLPVGQSTVVTIQVTVNAGVTTAFTNTATADPATAACPPPGCENETAANLANNTDSVTVSAGGPSIDLAVTSVQDFPDAVARGDVVTYTIVAVNGGTTTANNVKVRDTLTGNTGLGGLAVVSATASQGFACDNDIGDSKIECTGTLLAGQSTTITIVLQTQAGAPTSLTSTIKVDPDNAFVEADETNNERVEVTTISDSICTSCKDLVISAVLESSDPVADEGTLTYTVTVGNIGDQSTDTGAGNQALIFFDLGVSGGAQFEFVSESATAGFTCTQVTNTATSLLTDCSGELGPGQGTIITINVKAKNPGSITATATADPNNTITEFLETNNGPSTATTTVN